MHGHFSNSPAEEHPILDGDDPSVPGAAVVCGNGPPVDDPYRPSSLQVSQEDTDGVNKRGLSSPRQRNSTGWRNVVSQHSSFDTQSKTIMPFGLSCQRLPMDSSVETEGFRRSHTRYPWSCSPLALATTLLALLSFYCILHSFETLQVDPTGCGMPSMRPTYIKLLGFDTEHTRFAGKYGLYLYREGGVDEYSEENIGVWLCTLPFCMQLRCILTFDPAKRCSCAIPPWKCGQLQTGPFSSLRSVRIFP